MKYIHKPITRDEDHSLQYYAREITEEIETEVQNNKTNNKR